MSLTEEQKGLIALIEGLSAMTIWGPEHAEIRSLLALVRELDERASKAEDEAEQLRVQLAGCGVAALGDVAEDRVAKRGDYGWSASYQDVVDIRRRLDKAERSGSATTP